MQRYVEEVAVGTALEPVRFGPISTKDLVKWAAAADDYHEIHYDKDYALAQGLPNVVVHGPLKLGLMGRLLMGFVGAQGWLQRFNCRYGALDVPGTTLEVGATVTAVRPESGEVELAITVVNELGTATASGSATVRLPRRGAPAV